MVYEGEVEPDAKFSGLLDPHDGMAWVRGRALGDAVFADDVAASVAVVGEGFARMQSAFLNSLTHS